MGARESKEEEEGEEREGEEGGGRGREKRRRLGVEQVIKEEIIWRVK